MNKKLLSIITSASLLVSAFAMNAGAVPSAVVTGDSALEYIPESAFGEVFESSGEDTSYGPKAIETVDSAEELNTVFGKPEIDEGAYLFADLEGEGTQESPYLISSADQLFAMATDINSGSSSNAHYKLTADIDLGGAEWTPAGYYSKGAEDPYSTAFKGVFDGDGHTVSNFVITKADTAYIGFFGLVYGGSIMNLNIDNAVINVNSTNRERFYTGTVVARFVVNEADKSAVIENCNVTSSSITASTFGTIYAGGIAGSVYAANFSNAVINVNLSSAECDITVKSSATSKLDASNFHLVVVGGLIGYFGAETNAVANVLSCNANCDIYADALSAQMYAFPIAGGMFGDIHIQDNNIGGTCDISLCHSEGTVVTKSNKAYLVGGFTGQIYANTTTYINNCYSSSDVSGECTLKETYPNEDSAAGGFVGVIGYPYYSSYFEKQIINCYASGDAIDLTHTQTSSANSSYACGFAGWTDAAMFENCFKFESQRIVASNIPAEDVTVLTEDKAVYSEYYTGFDFESIWQIDSSAEYHYPTLQKKIGYVKFFANGTHYSTGVFGENGKAKAPDTAPTKAPTVDKSYTFIYWSLTENGSAFDFANTSLTENTNLYAVFTESPREYKINFVVDDTAYVPEQSLVYGSELKAPISTPEKAETEQYYYEFLYWSAIAGGEEYDFTSATVSGDMTFHAVFNVIDKSAWTGGIAESFAVGFGTQEIPYVISTSDEFALFAKVINEAKAGYTDAYYVLGNNINLGGNYWAAIGTKSAPFSANFDGKGYSVCNFKVSPAQYAGLFGYVLNGTIKNVYVTDFTINISPVYDENKYIWEYNASDTSLICGSYIGGLAAYIDSRMGVSEISGVRVSATSFNIDADFNGYIYAGNIAGYVCSKSQGDSLIIDSFATSPITVNNIGGYAYAGGIAGQVVIKSGGLSQIIRCYNIGAMRATSRNSSYAGGLVGYLMSNGSDFVGASDEDSAILAVEDFDIMIKDSFAVASVYSNSSKYNSNVGRIAANINDNVGHDGAYYIKSSEITVTPNEETKFGYLATVPNLQSSDWLIENCGFDFENTWTFISDFDYPVLKSMVSDKPILEIVSTTLSDGTLSASIRVLSKEQNYTLVIGVYNARNQLIKFERINLEKTDSFKEIGVIYENAKNAKYISVSAIETTSLKPLFSEVTKNI